MLDIKFFNGMSNFVLGTFGSVIGILWELSSDFRKFKKTALTNRKMCCCNLNMEIKTIYMLTAFLYQI